MKILAAILLCFYCLPAPAQTEFLKPDGLSTPKGYTHVVIAHPGKMVFISGQVANNAQGQLVGKDDLKAQAVQVFENLKTALAAAGARFDDVVKITWYVKAYKPEYLGTLREVRKSICKPKCATRQYASRRCFSFSGRLSFGS